MVTTKTLDSDSITLVSKINVLLVTSAFIASLLFNGIDLRFYSLTFLLLLLFVLNTAITTYRKGVQFGNPLIPTMIALFWLWLGISVFFSPVLYLSTVNFWWVGLFPLMFFVYSLSSNKDLLFKYAFVIITIVVLFLCIYAFYQLFVLHQQPRATFLNKNSLAALVNLQFFPIFAVTLLAESKKRLIVLLAIIFIFTLLLGLINSRGAFLAFSFGLLIMLAFSFSVQKKRRLFYAVLIIMCALSAAHLSLQNSSFASDNSIVENISSLQDTESAGQSRFVIWEPAWKLFKQNIWTGIGLGTYFLKIPPYLHPDDHSAGYYVHNDYLQIALETGTPGFILLVAILFSVTYRFVATIKITQKDEPLRLVIVAIFAAMLSVAIHSLFTFNLYILPTMLVLGLFLGYFNYLADRLQGNRLNQFRPSKLLRPLVYYFCVTVGSLSLFSYFTSIGIAYHYQNKGYQLAANVKLEEAHQAFQLAQTLSPFVDSPYFADANLLRKSALVIASSHPELATGLLQEATVLLNLAESKNPLRPNTPYIRGLVFEQATTYRQAEIIDAYQIALNRNPRFLPARIALARYLIKLDKTETANQLLREGLRFSYRLVTPSYLELIELNHAAAEQTGNTELAQNLSELLIQYQQIYAVIQSDSDQNRIINPY